MPIAPHDIDLFICGKLRFPCDSRKLTKVTVINGDSTYQNFGSDTLIPYHWLSCREDHGHWSIERRVLACHVAVAFVLHAATPVNEFEFGVPGWKTKGEFLSAGELVNRCVSGREKNGESSNALPHVLLFIDEDVAVQNCVTFGSTAAESQVFDMPAAGLHGGITPMFGCKPGGC